MPKYEAETPLQVEHESPLDRHRFRAGAGVKLLSVVRVGTTDVELRIDGTAGSARIAGIDADDEDAAFRDACRIFDRALSVVTLEIAQSNPNPHYGHMRVAWRAGSVVISPRDRWPADSLAIQMTLDVEARKTAQRLQKVLDNPALALVVASITQAMGDGDYRSKFYHAFSVMEYLEAQLTEQLDCEQLLSKEDLDKVCDLARYQLQSTASSAHGNRAKRVVERIRSTLSDATVEARAEKLSRIVTEFCGVRRISGGSGSVDVDVDLIRRFIALRNRLFHAGQAEANPALVEVELRDATMLLIQLTTAAAAYLLDRDAG